MERGKGMGAGGAGESGKPNFFLCYKGGQGGREGGFQKGTLD